MRGTDIDDVRIASDAVVQMVKVDHVGYLTLGQQTLKHFHGRSVICSVVESEMTDLMP